VTAAGWNLLHERDQAQEERATHGPAKPIDSFYPLTMPITVGPGSIAVAITIGSQRPQVGLTDMALLGGAATVGPIAISATIYVCYRFAEETVGVLGEQGTNVVIRLSAFILVCIGIEIVWGGYSALAHLTGEP
jgi:multiple antibiotic resistance protein